MNRPPAKVLIVDDEPNIRLVFRRSLEGTGHGIAEAGDGDEALALLRQEPYDLVLLDLRMPLVDGMETLRRMRDEGLRVPVILITAHGSIPDAVRALRLGAVDFLAKPVVPGDLRAAVSEVLARHETLGREPGTRRAPASDVARFSEALARAKHAMNHLRPNEAEAFLRRAIELDPRSAEARTLLGVVLEDRGELLAARESFQAALEADPAYAPAEHNLQHMAARYGPNARLPLG
jgi:DNA-binding response OmpR family regulator